MTGTAAAPAEAPKYLHQGIGRDLQKTLLATWYEDLATPDPGRPVVYTFIPGNIAELLRAFDCRLVFPEVNALQCGIKKVSGDFILRAEDAGYSSDVCGYVKNDVGLLLSGNQAPMGQIPRPDLLLLSYTGCTTFIKWFEALAHFYGAPIFMLDVPYLREGRIRPEDTAYVVAQLTELIALLEKMTGRSYQEERLREILRLSAQAEEAWVKILHSARRRPSPFDAYFEAVFFMAPIYVLRGTRECIDYYEAAWAEITERIERGIGPVPEERFRVVIEGPPPWPHFRAFWELFKKWGVTAVASSYSKVGGYWDHGFRHDPERPLESLAEYCLLCYTNQSLSMRWDLLERYLSEYEADGLVIHSVKSCRSFSVGQADMREDFSGRKGIPTLLIESDLADPRYFQEAQLRNRIDAFFEALEHRKVTQAGKATGQARAGSRADGPEGTRGAEGARGRKGAR